VDGHDAGRLLLRPHAGSALEAELLWDFASTELPASFFLPFSWGIYLDYWGELLGVGRKDEARATGRGDVHEHDGR
jgi:hypothetical protein